MREKQKHQEERLKAALERAVAQPKKKVRVLLLIGPATSKCECFCGIKTKYLIHRIYPDKTSEVFLAQLQLVSLWFLVTFRIIQITG